MKKMVDSLVKHLNNLVLVVGAVVMAVGAGMIYLPVGFLVGGGLAVAGAVLSIWGEGEDA